jgi:hypothetical protein
MFQVGDVVEHRRWVKRRATIVSVDATDSRCTAIRVFWSCNVVPVLADVFSNFCQMAIITIVADVITNFTQMGITGIFADCHCQFLPNGNF